MIRLVVASVAQDNKLEPEFLTVVKYHGLFVGLKVDCKYHRLAIGF